MKLKIAIIGPSEAGKTALANLLGTDNLAENNGSQNSMYRPTDSVRIVELTVPNVELKKYNTELDVQLWEIGGNPKLKSIWPAVQRDLDGVIIVYNVHNESHIKDSSALHMHFVTHSPTAMQCFIIGNTFRGMREIGPQRILGVSKRVRHIAGNIEDETNTKGLVDEFMQFVTSVAQVVHEREKANLVGIKIGSRYVQSTSKKLTAVDRRNENLSIALARSAAQRRSISTAITNPTHNFWMHSSSSKRTDRIQTARNFNGDEDEPECEMKSSKRVGRRFSSESQTRIPDH